MTPTRRRTLLSIAVALFACSGIAAEHRAAILDRGGKALTIVDLSKGAVAGKVPLADAPRAVYIDPRGRKLLVVSRGEGSESFWTSTFHPQTKSSAVVVDAATLKPAARAELGWDVADPVFRPDGSAALILTPGVSSDKAAENRPAELIRIDLASGDVAKRVTLDRAAKSVALSGDGATALVWFAGSKKGAPSELRLYDAQSLDARGTVAIAGVPDAPIVPPSGDAVYLLDDATGKLSIVSVSGAKLSQTLDVGSSAKLLAIDPGDGRMYVASGGRDAKLSVIKDGQIAATTSAPPGAFTMRFADDHKTAFLVGAGSVSRLDLSTLQASAPVETWQSTNDLILGPGAHRAFGMHRAENWCCQMSIVDLDSGKRLNHFVTGSKGARLLQGLGAAAATMSSYQAGKSAAVARGGGSFTYSLYTPKTASAVRGPLAVRPDGKFAYALDAQTDAVSVANADTGERVATIGVYGGAHEIVPMPGGKVLATISDKGITFIDMNTNDKAGQIPFDHEVRDFALAGSRGIALTKSTAFIIDTAAGTQLATIDGLNDATTIVLLND